MSALSTCESELRACRRFHDANQEGMIRLGQECREMKIDCEDARARYLEGRISMYLSMIAVCANAADQAYYRRCEANLTNELAAMTAANNTIAE